MKTVIIDNYDSFTYNLRHLVRELAAPGDTVDVLRNDKFELNSLEPFDKIILSPGPGIPSEAGLLMDVIRRYSPSKSILGVCLGHQAIGEVFGASLSNLDQMYHGVQLPAILTKNHDYIFDDMPENFPVGRYHSWVVDNDSIPDCIQVTAVTPDGLVMALRHASFDVHGIQFHPESVLTPMGSTILANFLKHSTPLL